MGSKRSSVHRCVCKADFNTYRASILSQSVSTYLAFHHLHFYYMAQDYILYQGLMFPLWVSVSLLCLLVRRTHPILFLATFLQKRISFTCHFIKLKYKKKRKKRTGYSDQFQMWWNQINATEIVHNTILRWRYVVVAVNLGRQMRRKRKEEKEKTLGNSRVKIKQGKRKVVKEVSEVNVEKG